MLFGKVVKAPLRLEVARRKAELLAPLVTMQFGRSMMMPFWAIHVEPRTMSAPWSFVTLALNGTEGCFEDSRILNST